MDNKSGFSLLETIVAMGLSVLLLLGLAAIFSGTLTLWTRIQESGDILKEARGAVGWLTRDIRENKIIAPGEYSIAFSDAEYSWSGNALKRNGDLVARGVTQLSFSYHYDDENPEQVRFVAMVFKIKHGTNEVEFRNGAGVRNHETVL